MNTGTVKFYYPDEKYGCITTEDGRDFFIHASTLESLGITSLQPGQKVSFNWEQGNASLQEATLLNMI